MKLLNHDEHAASETSPLPPSAFVKVKSAVVLAFHFNKLIKIVQICFEGLKYDFVLVTRDDDHWLGQQQINRKQKQSMWLAFE